MAWWFGHLRFASPRQFIDLEQDDASVKVILLAGYGKMISAILAVMLAVRSASAFFSPFGGLSGSCNLFAARLCVYCFVRC
jgi:hypothetical protein